MLKVLTFSLLSSETKMSLIYNIINSDLFWDLLIDSNILTLTKIIN